ncbi:SMP-30/gluconolactonase/LRE family protein [Cohnella suwonensis]|uniref:Regucalcin n=1 Tax=Cohnella suwonensis TaxID=696072 RepID=A0ABW0M0I6_9BACL
MQDKTLNLKLVCDAKAKLGEGPVWDTSRGCLYWVDILESRLHIHDPQHPQSDESIVISPYISSIVPRLSGGIALTLQNGFYAFDRDTQKTSLLAEVESTLTDNRFNDGKCDPAGRYLAGTMSMSYQPSKGTLYRMDANHSVRPLLSEVSISNGLAWTADGTTMYYVDTPTRQVAAFDYDMETGTLRNRRIVVEIPEEQGFPDGMTIDSEGMIWVAHWGGWRVTRWNPNTGKQLEYVPVPASQVTSCTFGGPNLDKLYITTARIGLNEEELTKQPHAGGLFCAELVIRGTPAVPFQG